MKLQAHIEFLAAFLVIRIPDHICLELAAPLEMFTHTNKIDHTHLGNTCLYLGHSASLIAPHYPTCRPSASASRDRLGFLSISGLWWANILDPNVLPTHTETLLMPEIWSALLLTWYFSYSETWIVGGVPRFEMERLIEMCKSIKSQVVNKVRECP